MTPHPPALGSALTHPGITTDFSEAQIELITGVHTGVESCLEELRQIHQFTYRRIGEELLWGASMPCCLPQEQAIPIARYGRSNLGRAKTVYRIGLSHRYGRRMQTISGVHYNFSLPPDAWEGAAQASAAYFALIRNFRRHAWLLLYLFGASPAVSADFVQGREHGLAELVPGTLYLPHATSLRMGNLGYKSAAQESLAVSYNDLASYSASLQDALTTPYPAYAAIGLGEGDDYRQLATSLLQIENEFYGVIRPKRVVLPGERPLHALRARGVEYLEVRAMDLDPFSPVGVAAGTMRFLDVFLLHALLSESPPDSRAEIEALGRNLQQVATRGREPGVVLEKAGRRVPLREWAGELLRECEPVAALLDVRRGSGHRAALGAARDAVDDPTLLPSARVLAQMQRHHGGSYCRFALHHSRRHREALQAEPLPAEVEAAMAQRARESLAEQERMEAEDLLPFETFRQQYLAQEL